MARKKKPQVPRPQLIRFLLIGLNAANGYVGQGVLRLVMRRENDIELATMTPGDSGDSSRVAVRVKATIFGRKEGEEEDRLHIEGLYEARFAFPGEVAADDVEKLIDDEAFQYSVVSQVFPLVTTHLKSQLDLMGLSTGRLPLGV